MPENKLSRPIKSFVIRSGRMTASQQQAFDEYWSLQGLNAEDGLINQQQLFGRTAPLVLEIGFGMGVSLAEMAEKYPNTDFIGVEVHKPGIGNLLKEINQRGLSNVRMYWEDVLIVLDKCCSGLLLDRIQLFFPDPWPKRRHYKRRLVQAPFVQKLHSKIKQGGVLHMATDWKPYAEHMLAVMEAAQGFRNIAGSGKYSERPEYRPITKFEKRGLLLGHGVWDLLFEKVA